MSLKNLHPDIDKSLYALAVARISLGFIMVWAFADKLYGLGFSTCRDAKTDVVTNLCSQAWLSGGSPTKGFLSHSVGPFSNFYTEIAGQAWANWLFMAGLLLIGLALISGIGVKVATVSGAILMLMMWSASLPPTQNPLLDDHIVYISMLIAILLSNKNQKIGLGRWWQSQTIVKKYSFLA